jgi:hypothetical protein
VIVAEIKGTKIRKLEEDICRESLEKINSKMEHDIKPGNS